MIILKKRFFVCEHCGNIIAMIRDCGVAVYCCGEKMKWLDHEATDGAEEKHLPIYDVKDDVVSVRVGKQEHPMTPEHFIEWICLETQNGFQYKQLKAEDAPRASFPILKGEKVLAVYAFCNRHSLWKA